MATSATAVWDVVKICVECLVGWRILTPDGYTKSTAPWSGHRPALCHTIPRKDGKVSFTFNGREAG
ncbi:MAG: hypothetical protein Q9172_004276 [Xanthocarpia lactea]